MLVCPNCKSEYRDGFNTCVDCGEALAKMPELPPEPPPKKSDEYQYVYAEPTLLCAITDDIHADILIAALRENDIPVHLIRRGAGAYIKIITAMNVYGVEIYVPSAMIDKAQEIYSNIYFSNAAFDGFEDNVDEEFVLKAEREVKNKRIFFLLWVANGVVYYVILIRDAIIKIIRHFF